MHDVYSPHNNLGILVTDAEASMCITFASLDKVTGSLIFVGWGPVKQM